VFTGYCSQTVSRLPVLWSLLTQDCAATDERRQRPPPRATIESSEQLTGSGVNLLAILLLPHLLPDGFNLRLNNMMVSSRLNFAVMLTIIFDSEIEVNRRL